ncbi:MULTISPECIES: hypothetical protein [Pseudomonas]|uniref:hypothetical protein n=1 Tax=Pseudomonas TaxID=286 RepID=UPI000CFF1B38|nr:MULTISPECIES: hypothetical protein [Pseudomonas]PRA51946.1 hypothetical protein CQZ98_17350 [Pseudomonas sp. MYb115]QXN51394.1 hypothetical protein KW062_06485 [Pseudomonas fluorescens]WSO25713.1 hypothetical protein VUJ50_06510 [Pseudomonas fluorescens]
MPFSEIFHPECEPIEPHDAPNHVVFSCLQWKTPSLEVMPQAAKQSFAVMSGDHLNPYVTAALERAYILGAMSPVKLIAVHEDSLRLFLDSGVSSATFQEVESLWEQVICMSHIRLTVDFENVNEVHSGHSDYVFWQDAKEILESYSLGIAPYDLKALDDFSDIGFIDEDLWFRQSQEDGQPETIQHCPIETPNFAEIMGHNNCLMSLHYIYPNNRKPDA